MEKNKIYLIMFVLLFFLTILLGAAKLLSNNLTKSANVVVPTGVVQPTSSFIPPTRVPTILTEASASAANVSSNRIFSFTYPVNYQAIMIDYIPSKDQMIVYYPTDKASGQEMFNSFLSENSDSSIAQLNLKVEYIGLERDADEPPPGTPLKD